MSNTYSTNVVFQVAHSPDERDHPSFLVLGEHKVIFRLIVRGGGGLSILLFGGIVPIVHTLLKPDKSFAPRTLRHNKHFSQRRVV